MTTPEQRREITIMTVLSTVGAMIFLIAVLAVSALADERLWFGLDHYGNDCPGGRLIPATQAGVRLATAQYAAAAVTPWARARILYRGAELLEAVQ